MAANEEGTRGGEIWGGVSDRRVGRVALPHGHRRHADAGDPRGSRSTRGNGSDAGPALTWASHVEGAVGRRSFVPLRSSRTAYIQSSRSSLCGRFNSNSEVEINFKCSTYLNGGKMTQPFGDCYFL